GWEVGATSISRGPRWPERERLPSVEPGRGPRGAAPMTKGAGMRRSPGKAMALAAIAIALAVVAGAGSHDARAVLPPGNTVQQWDKIAEDTVVGSGAFQNEGLIYMAYTSSAMYDAGSPAERQGQ